MDNTALFTDYAADGPQVAGSASYVASTWWDHVKVGAGNLFDSAANIATYANPAAFVGSTIGSWVSDATTPTIQPVQPITAVGTYQKPDAPAAPSVIDKVTSWAGDALHSVEAGVGTVVGTVTGAAGAASDTVKSIVAPSPGSLPLWLKLTIGASIVLGAMVFVKAKA